MKKTKIIAALAAMMCCVTSVSAPSSAIASVAESSDRDQVYDSSLVLDGEIANTLQALNRYLWDNQIKAYTVLKEGRDKIGVIGDTFEALEPVKAFVRENGLNESLIEYGVESFENLVPDGEETITPVTNEELETLVTAMQNLNTFLNESGYLDDSAYAALYWGKHSIECFVKTYAVHDAVIQFMKENEIAETLVDVIVSPECDFHVGDGGQRSYDEVNTIVADEYISLKNYLNDSGILSNIYLTTKQDKTYPDVSYTCVEIYVKTQEDANAMKAYMTENSYWQDVVEITVKSDLSSDTDSTIHNKAYVCLAGDSNDDGQFGISDVIKLQKWLLTADTMYERQGYASDLTGDGRVDVFDLCLSKRKLING
ncbi:MAG: dockerin type I repeat-containing protein [Oribacterium sp.]|nr:dockerin type I repeat-containing protein [Oribacterium sp.]